MIGGKFFKENNTARGKKTALFRNIAKNLGFKKGKDHSEYTHEEYTINICFYPCTYGVKIHKDNNLTYQSFDIEENEFITKLTNIKK